MTDTASDAPVTPAPLRSPWDRFFFEPQSTAPMTLVRVGLGLLATMWAISLLPDVDPFLTDGALRYDRDLPAGSWNPLEWISWDQAPLVACILLAFAGVSTALGYRTRLSTVVVAVCLISLQRTNSAIFNSGDLVLRQIAIAVALAPCGVLLSLDARRARKRGAEITQLRAPFAMRLLQLELAVGYLLSAWVKLRGATWHEGTALGKAMRIEDLQRFVAPEWWYRQAEVLNALTWITLVFEGAFIFMVWNRRLRPWVLGLGVAFHLGIDIFFDIGFFSAAMWLAYLAFMPPEVADRVVARLDSLVDRVWGSDHRDPPAITSRRDAVPLTVEPTE